MLCWLGAVCVRVRACTYVRARLCTKESEREIIHYWHYLQNPKTQERKILMLEEGAEIRRGTCRPKERLLRGSERCLILVLEQERAGQSDRGNRQKAFHSLLCPVHLTPRLGLFLSLSLSLSLSLLLFSLSSISVLSKVSLSQHSSHCDWQPRPQTAEKITKWESPDEDGGAPGLCEIRTSETTQNALFLDLDGVGPWQHVALPQHQQEKTWGANPNVWTCTTSERRTRPLEGTPWHAIKAVNPQMETTSNGLFPSHTTS